MEENGTVNGTSIAQAVLRNLRPCAQFVSIKGYTKKAGSSGRLTDGVSDVVLCLGIDYGKLLDNCRATVEALTDESLLLLSAGKKAYENARKKDSPLVELTLGDLKEARDKVLASLEVSSQPGGHRKANGQEDPYEPLRREDGTTVTGIKVHKETGNVQLWGLLISEKKIQEPEYKPSKTGVQALAKKLIEDETRKGKFRQYVLKAGQFGSVKLEGVEIQNGHFKDIQPLLAEEGQGES